MFLLSFNHEIINLTFVSPYLSLRLVSRSDSVPNFEKGFSRIHFVRQALFLPASFLLTRWWCRQM